MCVLETRDADWSERVLRTQLIMREGVAVERDNLGSYTVM